MKASNLEKAIKIATEFMTLYASMPKEAWGVNINPKSQLDLLSNKDTIMKMRRNHLSSFWYTSKVPSMIVTNLFVVSFSIHIFESPYTVKAIQQVCTLRSKKNG